MITQLNKDDVKSFIYGAVMSGIMNGGQVAFTAVTSVGLVKINNLSEAIAFAKENGVDIDNSQIDGIMSETKQSSVSSDSSIGESKVQTSSINPSNLDIDNQIAMANYHTDKGLTTTIDIEPAPTCDKVPAIYFIKDGEVVSILRGRVTYEDVESALEEIGITK